MINLCLAEVGARRALELSNYSILVLVGLRLIERAYIDKVLNSDRLMVCMLEVPAGGRIRLQRACLLNLLSEAAASGYGTCPHQAMAWFQGTGSKEPRFRQPGAQAQHSTVFTTGSSIAQQKSGNARFVANRISLAEAS